MHVFVIDVIMMGAETNEFGDILSAESIKTGEQTGILRSGSVSTVQHSKIDES